MLLWPPSPKSSSWKTDTPNEGLIICDGKDGDPGIFDLFADYQGFIIVEPVDGLMSFEPLRFAPTRDRRYLEAYQIMLEECSVFWELSAKPKTWTQVCRRIVKRLKAVGWFEVEAVESGNRYFQRKGAK